MRLSFSAQHPRAGVELDQCKLARIALLKLVTLSATWKEAIVFPRPLRQSFFRAGVARFYCAPLSLYLARSKHREKMRRATA